MCFEYENFPFGTDSQVVVEIIISTRRNNTETTAGNIRAM